MNPYLLSNEIALLINLISNAKMLIRQKKTHKEKWHLPGMLLQLPVRKVARSCSPAGVTGTQCWNPSTARDWAGSRLQSLRLQEFSAPCKPWDSFILSIQLKPQTSLWGLSLLKELSKVGLEITNFQTDTIS